MQCLQDKSSKKFKQKSKLYQSNKYTNEGSGLTKHRVRAVSSKYLLGIMVGLLSADWESRDLVRTVTARGLSPTSLPMSISAWSPVGESTSVTFLPSAYTAYPVTGPDEGGRVTGCQVTRRVPSCGPASTWISWARSERVGGVFEKKEDTLTRSILRGYAGFFKGSFRLPVAGRADLWRGS